MDRGQVTVEFISVMGLVAVIFLVMITLINAERKTSAQTMWSQDAQDLAEGVADAIDSIYVAGPGASLNMTLPGHLSGGVNYTLEGRPHLVTVNVSTYGREFEWKFSADLESGGQASINIPHGRIAVTNDNGSVTVTEV